MAEKFDTFVEIGREEEEIIRMASFLAKIKKDNLELETEFKKKIEESPDNYKDLLAYSFYMWFQVDDQLDLNDTNYLFKVSINVIDSIDLFLYDYPEYWILQLLKYRIRSFMNIEEEKQIPEVKNLVELQHSKKYPSYFLTMDILLSFFYTSFGQFKQAEIVLHDIFNHYEGRVNILREFFLQFIKEYKNSIKRSPNEEIENLLNEIEKKYF